MPWEGAGLEEKGYGAASGRCIVTVDPRYFRPTEVETLLDDPTKAREKLGWVPEISFEQLVAEMMREDLKEAERDALCRRQGFQTLVRNEEVLALRRRRAKSAVPLFPVLR